VATVPGVEDVAVFPADVLPVASVGVLPVDPVSEVFEQAAIATGKELAIAPTPIHPKKERRFIIVICCWLLVGWQ
jgi:hypothetical protein